MSAANPAAAIAMENKMGIQTSDMMEVFLK